MTEEIVMDWRRKRADPAPIQREGICGERVSSFRLLSRKLADVLRWYVNTAVVACQHSIGCTS